jgi:hypothetical protein
MPLIILPALKKGSIDHRQDGADLALTWDGVAVLQRSVGSVPRYMQVNFR